MICFTSDSLLGRCRPEVGVLEHGSDGSIGSRQVYHVHAEELATVVDDEVVDGELLGALHVVLGETAETKDCC